MVNKALNYLYSYFRYQRVFWVKTDTYFPIFHSNKTYMVQQVIGIMCVMLKCQEHPLFHIKRLYFLIPSFQPFLSAVSTLSFHQWLHQGMLYVTPAQCSFHSMWFLLLVYVFSPNKITFCFHIKQLTLVLTLSHTSSCSSLLLTTRAEFTIFLVEQKMLD